MVKKSGAEDSGGNGAEWAEGENVREKDLGLKKT